MTTKRWRIEVDGRPHEVVLRHGYFSARRHISVDGVEVLDERPGLLEALRLWNTATEHPLVIAGHPAAVRIDPTIDNMTYRKVLILDGKDVESGRAMAALPESANGRREGRWMAGYGGCAGFALSIGAAVVGITLLRLALEALARR